MEIPFRSFFSSLNASIEEDVHPVLIHLIALLIPMNIYIIGDWLGSGVQWALLRYQETYLGRDVISILTDFGYILQGIFHGRTAISVGAWILGALLLVLGLLIALLQDRERSRRIRGYLLISGSLLFLLSIVIQYGALFNGPAGIGIPIGIPALLGMGIILLKPPRNDPVPGKERPLLSRRAKEILLLFVVCFLVYNTISFIRMSGDTTPAQIIPLSILKYGSLSCDWAFPDVNNTGNLYAFVQIQGHYFSYFPLVTPILVTPLYLLPSILISVAGIPLNIVLIASLARFAAAIVAATGVVIVYLNARALLSKTTAFLTTITYAFGTTTWAISSQALWQQGTIELLLALLIFTIIRNEAREAGWHLMVLGILSGLLVMARPPDAILLIPVLLYILWYHRSKAYLYVIPGILSAFPFILYNFLLFGSPLGGYERTAALMGISASIPIRFLGYLIAPNMGFFIFSPVLIFGLAGYFRRGNIRNPRLQEILTLYGPTLILSIVVYSF
ncbi:MAG: glycosyltransferase family 39 protein [Methanomicrobiales archaeon]|nr:glycosyltransferase family 39 protein [Methanomicrobiales archaeon]